MPCFKLHKTLLICFAAFAPLLFQECKEHSNYNPFDDQINVSLSHFCKDGCDTTGGDCAYFKLTQQADDSIYFSYSFFAGKPHKATGKSFTIYLDTFEYDQMGSSNISFAYKDSLEALKTDKTELVYYLDLYDYRIINKNSNPIKIYNPFTNDSAIIYTNVGYLNDSSLVKTFKFSNVLE